MLGRIGVIGDIHAEDRALEVVLEDFAARDLERILAVGDVVDGPGDSARCCRLLVDHAVEVVRGNHDRWALAGQMRGLPDAKADLEPAERRFLEALPATREYETAVGRLLLCHGLGADDMCRLTADDYGYALETNDALQALLRSRAYRVVIGGHTHRRMVRAFGELAIINAGTLFRAHDPCAAVVDFGDRTCEFLELGGGELEPGERHEF